MKGSVREDRAMVRELRRTVALAAPVVRLMAIRSRIKTNADESTQREHEAFPVVFVRTEVVDRYEKYVRGGTSPDEGNTHRAMRERGWWHTDREVRDSYQVVDEPIGTLCDAADFFDTPYQAWRLVACPWGPEEDESRFAPLFAKLDREADARAAKYEHWVASWRGPAEAVLANGPSKP